MKKILLVAFLIALNSCAEKKTKTEDFKNTELNAKDNVDAKKETL